MNLDFTAIAALVVVLVLFFVIFKLSKKLDFTLLVIVALAAGVAIGFIFHGHTSWITPIGKAYVSVLSALVSPLIIVAIISSITSLENTKQLKGIGFRSIGWLITTTFFAIMLALGLGVGRNAYLSIDGLDTTTFQSKVTSFSEIFINFFPRNVISDIAEENTIPMIFTAILVAVAYVFVAHDNEEKVKSFKNLVEALKEIIFKILDWVIELTPYAVLTLVATSVGNGINSSGMIWSLVMLLIVCFIAFIIDSYLMQYYLKFLQKLTLLSSSKKFFRHRLLHFQHSQVQEHYL